MEDTKSNDDALNQRLKNRERQRRYRAKKRQEAHSTKADSLKLAQAYILMQEAQREEAQRPLSQVPVIDTASSVYCKRKWKKEARLAHLLKQQASGSSHSTSSPAGSSHESEAPHLLLQLRGESSLGSGLHGSNSSSRGEVGTKTSAPVRRKWKVEARNKI